MDIYPATSNIELLTAITAVAAPLAGAKVRWWSGATVPDANTVLADLTPAAYGGFGDSTAVVWGTPIKDVDGRWKAVAASKQARQTSSPPNDTITGWGLIADPAGTPHLACSLRYATARSFVRVGVGDVVAPWYGLSTGVDGIAYSNATQLEILDFLTGAAGFLDDAALRLSTLNVRPNEETTLATLDAAEADFDGYTTGGITPLVWGTAFIDSDGVPKIQAASVQWSKTAGSTTNTVHIAYLVADVGGTPRLVGSLWYPDGLPFLTVGQGHVFDPEFDLSQRA